MAARFAYPQFIGLSCLGGMLETYHKLQRKPKTALDLDELQRIWTALPQKSIAKGVKDFCK